MSEKDRAKGTADHKATLAAGDVVIQSATRGAPTAPLATGKHKIITGSHFSVSLLGEDNLPVLLALEYTAVVAEQFLQWNAGAGDQAGAGNLTVVATLVVPGVEPVMVAKAVA